MEKHLLILGAGPAGLSCAYQLGRQGIPVYILEKNSQVGGLCRTIPFQGFLFDVGPHRFFTKNKEVDLFWHEILGDEVIHVNRLTRIFYENSFFDYPLKPLPALKTLGLFKSVHAAASYMKSFALRRGSIAISFEDWVVSQFGQVLYEIFFKTYTEKVWGIPCSNISAEWASQRIKGLSLGSAILNGLMPSLNRKSHGIKSLIDQFDYPRKGAGQVYEIMAQHAMATGTRIALDSIAKTVFHNEQQIVAVQAESKEVNETLSVQHLFSSIPLTEFVFRLSPKPPENVLQAAKSLYYRDHITVNLIVNKRSPFPDNWFYVHAPEVRAARITSYGNFSNNMLSNPNMDALSIEYFAFSGDNIWKMPDNDLINFAKEEFKYIIGLTEKEFIDGFVIRERHSYPTYFLGYKTQLKVIRDYVGNFKNLTLIGRGGMYRYNNQDHAILSGLLAARNYISPESKKDIWEINEDNEYLEEIKTSPVSVHEQVRSSIMPNAVIRARSKGVFGVLNQENRKRG